MWRFSIAITYLLLLTRVLVEHYPANNYMFKINKRNAKTRFEVCSKLARKTPEQRHWHRSVAFIVNFEHTSHLVLLFILLTLSW